MIRRIMVVLGTRPEVIKLAPVIAALRARPETFETVICSTGQHRKILEQALLALDVHPDIRLDVMQEAQGLSELTTRLMTALRTSIDRVRPNRLIVQGDTTTAFTAALSAYYERIPVAHVEAGLRSSNRYSPFPEEFNRNAISVIADLHFAPTKAAADILISEGVHPASVHITGNTVVDALQSFQERAKGAGYGTSISAEICAIAQGPLPLVIATCHRRESFGEDLRAICRAIARIARDFPACRIVFPVHPNPAVRGPVAELLGSEANVDLLEPVSYPEFLFLLSHARLVLTDSGGVQEEAPSFGVPVLVLRRYTERIEAVDAGLSFVVGPDEEAIVKHAHKILHDNVRSPTAINPFGDGLAAQRIVKILAEAP
jgi:UDP-N-acetylglucosamine 2-epimerase (non-hydrolysing)